MRDRRAVAIVVAIVTVLSLTSLFAAESYRVYLPLARDARPTPTGVGPATATGTATATATATGTATSTSTATSTPTDTATSTATSTPTETATTPPPCVGIYPIGIDLILLDGDDFKDPGDLDPVDGVPDYGWRVIESGPYAGLTARRLNLSDSLGAGGLAWPRWNESLAPGGIPATSTEALSNSLRYPGNITLGFEEAPWPIDPPPVDYPQEPGVLSAGDWVYGSPGYSSALDDVLDDHVRNQHRLRLPIYSTALGTGANVSYRIADFGEFVLVAHGVATPPSPQKYLELVSLGRTLTDPVCQPTPTPTSTPTSSPTLTPTNTPTNTPTSTPTNTPTNTPTSTPTNTPVAPFLLGSVEFRPEYVSFENGVCTPRSDVMDGGPEWRDDIPPSHFLPVGGLSYPTVGEVSLRNIADETFLRVPIVAGAGGGLSYQKSAIPPGTYELKAYLFYRHPLDPAGTLPRLYSRLFVGGESSLSIVISIPAGPGQSLLVLQDLKLLLNGNVCAGG